MTGARARRLLSLIHYGMTDSEERECRLILTGTNWGDPSAAYAAAARLEILSGVPRFVWIAAGEDAHEDHLDHRRRKAQGQVPRRPHTGRLSSKRPNVREEPRAFRTGTWPEEN